MDCDSGFHAAGGAGREGGRLFLAGAGAGIDDDADLFPGLDETGAGRGVGELEVEVVEIAEVFEEGGGVGLDFFEEGAAVDDLAARVIEELGEGGDGRAENGDAGGSDAAAGGSGFTEGVSSR